MTIFQYLFGGVTINGCYLFVIPEWYLYLWTLGLGVVLAVVPWLANRPQPEPRWR